MSLTDSCRLSNLFERTAEMELLAAALDGVTRGEGGVVLLTGGPGVGKTALLDAFLRQAAASGAEVCAAAGSSAETGVALGVAGQLFSAHPRLGVGLSLARALGRRGGDPAPEPDAGRLFADLCREFRRRPVVLAVDDVQLADAASLDFLSHLLRRLRTAPVLLVLTESTGPSAIPPSFQAELLRHPQGRQRALLPLSEDGVARLVAARIGPAEAPGLAADFHAVSGGNPLLVHALLADHLSAPGPAGARTAAHSAFTKAALVWAYRDEPALFDVAGGIAVLGDSATATRVACLVGRETEAVEQIMSALDGAGLLRRGTFRAPAIGRAVLEHVDPRTRARLRRRAARLLHDDGAPATTVARHLIAAPVAEPWAQRVLLAAAEKALLEGDDELSLDCLRLVGQHPTTEQGRDAVAVARVRAGWRIDPRLSGPWLDSLVAGLGQGRLSGKDAAWTVKHLVWHGRLAEARASLAALDASSYAEDPRAQAELLVVRQWLRHTCPGLERELPGPGERRRGHRSPPCQVSPASYALEALTKVLSEGGDDDLVTTADEILRGARIGETGLEALESALLTLVHSDRLDRAQHRCDTLLAQTTSRASGTAVAVLRQIAAEIALRRGSLRAAEDNARLALDAISQTGWGVAIGGPLSVLVLAASAADTSGAAAAWLDRPVPEAMFHTRYGLQYTYARGRYHAAADRPAAALDDFLACGELAREWGLDVPGFLPWRIAAAEAHLALGEPDRARALAREQLTLPGSGTPRVRGAALRLLACTSELGRRPALLREAVDMLESSGDRIELIRALADRSQALHELGAPAKARTMARRARTVADACGADALFRRLCREEAAADEDGPETLVTDGGGVVSLTAAERRVTVLAALGHSNREIGRKLFITKSTVEQHLTRVYRKLGVRNRADLSDLLAGTSLAVGAPAVARAS
ncbi:AAA family ATPase [Streptomyces leeuwenhoekii]|uniref:helix-turn-helix transcriptional regulator n=1 Tax=Streptomyces leeuwenhoekii TaxID=1437453 RepID=UPI0036817277